MSWQAQHCVDLGGTALCEPRRADSDVAAGGSKKPAGQKPNQTNPNRSPTGRYFGLPPHQPRSGRRQKKGSKPTRIGHQVVAGSELSPNRNPLPGRGSHVVRSSRAFASRTPFRKFMRKPPRVVSPSRASTFLPCSGTLRILHGWRRHVCRNCTGHLALRILELQARKKETDNRTENNQPPKQHKTKPNTQPKTKQQKGADFLAACNSSRSCESETREEE